MKPMQIILTTPDTVVEVTLVLLPLQWHGCFEGAPF